MRIKQGFVLRNVCNNPTIMGEGLGVIDFGKLLVLNESAAWLWGQAQEMGDFTVEQLADKFFDAYETSKEDALNDVGQIVADWKSYGMISE
jgi:hypothetical protein